MKILSALITLISLSAMAQVENIETLDYNNISAFIGDEGVFFNRPSIGMTGFEVPKGSGKSTIYCGSVWVGAEDINGEFYFSGSNHSPILNSQFHSGPIANQAAYGSQAYENEYGKSIWKVSEAEISYHMLHYDQPGYSAPSSILDWPGNGNTSLGVAAQLAPFIDVNNDNMYTPLEGDYPDISGREAVYVILNDKSYNPDDNALGVELHLMFYQYDTGNYLSNTVFLHVQAFNRSTLDYYNFRESLYIDFDIGNYSDDYIGCDSANHVAFAYNADPLDEISGGNLGYGADPPCQGVVALSHDMYAFGYYAGFSQPPYTDYYASDTTLWNFMNASWGDGTHWTTGGLGYPSGTGTPTNFLFNGNPYMNTGWNEMNTFSGNGNAPGDRRGVLTIAENEFPAGSVICSDFAFIYDRSGSHLKNVQNVINIAVALRQSYSYQNLSPCSTNNLELSEVETEPDFDLYPNPSSGEITLEFVDFSDKEIVILDVTGKIVHSTKCHSNKIQLDLSELQGVYFIHVSNYTGNSVRKLIID